MAKYTIFLHDFFPFVWLFTNANPSNIGYLFTGEIALHFYLEPNHSKCCPDSVKDLKVFSV